MSEDKLKNKLMKLSLLSDKERFTLLHEWASAPLEYSIDLCIQQLVEAQVQRTPHAVALQWKQEIMTYRELNNRANQLAYYLREKGVKPNYLVAINLERSFDIIIAILAVLKAGGAYVPIDTSYPLARQQYIIQDSQASWLLSHSSLDHKFLENSLNFIAIDSLEKSLIVYSTENLLSVTEPQDLAYVIYTSGSTGEPKGVMITHKSLCNLAQAQVKAFAIDEQSRVLQFASPGFDASVSEWSTALTAGATLCLLSEEHLTFTSELIDVFDNFEITVVTLPPSLLMALPPERLTTVKTLITAGEPVTEKVISLWQDKVRLINAYGPTETTVCATMFECNNHYPPRTIGKPMAGVEVYLLDETLQPVPIGAIGELYISGAGVARGYWNKSLLTNQRFISHSFNKNITDRILYKTGDLARWLAGGFLEYVGRNDFQVKLNGYRIELGEIEEVCLRHPRVKEAIVLVYEESAGHKRLLAYVIEKNKILEGKEAYAFTEELKTFLELYLPSYMIPLSFILLSEFPLTTHGKIDRQSLAIIGDKKLKERQSGILPRTETEKKLATLWMQLLQLETVTVSDDFFKIGGDSVFSIQLLLQCQKLGIELTINQIFDFPVLEALAQSIDLSKNEKNKIAYPVISQQVKGTFIPLSFAQQRLWFLDSILEDKTTYNILLTIGIKGKLKKEALQQAFDQLFLRHELLRTSIQVINNEPGQVIIPHVNIGIEENDLTLFFASDKEDKNEFILAQSMSLMNIPFDLTKPPLMRAKLLKFSDKHSVLIVVMHHLISDAWSMDILFRELNEFYSAIICERAPVLPILPIQYADFSVWQRNLLKGAILEKQLLYWKNQLKNVPELLTLPTDRLRLQKQTHRGAYYTHSLPLSLLEKLQLLANENNVTLFMLLLTAFQALLHRYSGQEDIVVGSPTANRHYPDVDNLIGFFVNTLVLRTQIDSKTSFINLLAKVKEMTLAAYQNQDLPFEQLVENISTARNMSWHPIFQVIFGLQHAGAQELMLADLGIERVNIDMKISRFDLTVSANATDNGLTFGFEYATDLFNENTIKYMALHFEELIKDIIVNNKKRIYQLNLLTTDERLQFIEWNKVTSKVNHTCIHTLFENQVVYHSDKIAMLYENQSMTYKVLNERSNQLAFYLRNQCQVGPEVLVAICIERSFELIIVLLAILKAGGAYLPLDSHLPQERLAFILEDSKTTILLTESSLQSLFPNYPHQLIEIDKKSECWRDLPISNLSLTVNPYNLAYVIYTSGSTGQPKGVMIEHHSVCNLAQAQISLLGINSSSTVLQFASISFDAASWEWLSALTQGAQLYLISSNLNFLEQGIENLRCRERVTIATLPPSIAQFLPEDAFPSLKTLIVAGESCSDLLIQRWLNKCILINAYGPTEATVCASAFKCSSFQPAATIGRALENVQIHILDTYLQPVPIGVPGEMYIGGEGLARGYLNQPELTQKKFFICPILDGTSQRLYRTGDYARYLPDGNIEYLGREDDQVKIRGYRIELLEIEMLLVSFSEIKQAVVLTKPDHANQNYLIAYLLLADNVKQNENLILNLKSSLLKKLPAYMLPQTFIFVDQIPLTINGKIDKRFLLTLEETDQQNTKNGELKILPQTPTEKILGMILMDLLGTEEINTSEDFFEMGGDSILAIRFILQAQEQGLQLTVNDVFTTPIVRDLALIADNSIVKSALSLLPKINPREKEEIIPLSFAQQRLWFLDQILPDTSVYHIPLGLLLRGKLNISSLEYALNTLIKRHEIMRTVIQIKNDEPIQVVYPEFTLYIENNDFSALSCEEQTLRLNEYLLLRIKAPFNLEGDILIRAHLFTLNSDENILLLVMHHLIMDGWSLEIVLEELLYFYDCHKNMRFPSLPNIDIQYADFSIWQRNWLKNKELEKQIVYWKIKLKNLTEPLALPIDKIRPKKPTYKGAHYQLVLSKELLESLKALAEKSEMTLFMVLLAAFKIVLFRYTNQSAIAIGTPIANRHYPNVDKTVGFFVNTLVLLTHFDKDLTVKSLLADVRKTTVEAYQHQDLPFEQLVDCLNVSRHTEHHPLFQVLFSLQTLGKPRLAITELSIEPIRIDMPLAKFDLSLTACEFEEGLSLDFEYADDLFEESTLVRFSQHFEKILTQIVVEPEVKCSELNLLSTEEKYKILVKWNQTNINYAFQGNIHQLLEQKAIPYLDSVGIVYENRKITYREFHEKSNQLAHYLRQQGVETEVLVPIYMSRSPEFIVALLAVLKAGGAYIPLDIYSPQEGLDLILQDISPFIIITERNFQNKFTDLVDRILVLEDEEENIQRHIKESPSWITHPEALAYVIYTSGSTGKPKGVMIEHKGLVNYLLWCMDFYPSQGGEGTLLHSSAAFDMTITGYFLPLLLGKTIYLTSEKLGSQALPIILSEINRKYDFIKLTPSHLKLLKPLLNPSLCQQVNNLIVGGEQLAIEDISLWQSLAPDTLIYNEYGPTESTVACCVYPVTINKIAGAIPIGKPIANMQLYILDDYLQPVPIGVVGELYIGGVGLARGYLNDPHLTSKKFIPNPFITYNSRLYKSGDLARFLPNGTIEFLGRLDNQVKVNGYRIDLSEIESIICLCQNIRSVTVLVRDSLEGGGQLIAYIICKEHPQTIEMERQLAQTLHDFVALKLASYKIPQYFVFLEELPLTLNGKLDLKSLPIPKNSQYYSERNIVAARTPLEEEITVIWRDLLSIEKIGVFDNFFELGGHSLLMTQVILLTFKKFNTKISLKKFFEMPTIDNLAKLIEKKENNIHITSRYFQTDQILDPFISQIQFNHEKNIVKTVLLTGATGLLGIHLLFDLCEHTTATIYCLIRAENKEHAYQRLMMLARYYCLDISKYSTRIEPVIGDLGKPQLGLTQIDFDFLTKEIDKIYHNGAYVHHVFDYDTLRAVNVLGTKEIIKLASLCKFKPIHYVSTLGYFAKDDNDNIEEMFSSDMSEASLGGGYTQTKWVSEKLLAQANERGMDITIYRPGHITGQANTGIMHDVESNHFFNLVKGCLQLGFAPAWDMQLNWLPVDFTSQLIIMLSVSNISIGKVFNLTNRDEFTWKSLIIWLQQKGYSIEIVDAEIWKKELIQKITIDNALYSLLSIYIQDDEDSSKKMPQKKISIIDNNTYEFMEKENLKLPKVDDVLLEIYFSYLKSIGFLDL